MFQKIVNRQYTTGFPGEIRADGPLRVKPGRIDSVGAAPNQNRISRAFGWKSDEPALGNAGGVDYQGLDGMVEVGGANFYGLLIHPKHYALQGTQAGGTLAPSLDLPRGAEGEFCDMGIIIVELFNGTNAAQNVTYGDQLLYMPVGASAGDNPLGLPAGALFSVAAGAAKPAGAVLIPNARVTQSLALGASAVGALVSTYAVVQLTQ